METDKETVSICSCGVAALYDSLTDHEYPFPIVYAPRHGAVLKAEPESVRAERPSGPTDRDDGGKSSASDGDQEEHAHDHSPATTKVLGEHNSASTANSKRKTKATRSQRSTRARQAAQ